MLSTTPVRTANFQWDLDFNWAKNYNKVVSLPEGLEDSKSSLVGYDGVYTYAVVGRPIGVIYTTMPLYTADGKLIVRAEAG